MIELLVEAGLKKNIAKVLVKLAEGEAISRDIELDTVLRQPEVSHAIKEMKKLGWVEEEKLPPHGKGRPRIKYRLIRPFKDIVLELVNRKLEEVRELEKDMEELRKMVEVM